MSCVQNPSQSNSWTTCPNDILVQIFHYLDESTLAKCQRVCKRFQEVISNTPQLNESIAAMRQGYQTIKGTFTQETVLTGVPFSPEYVLDAKQYFILKKDGVFWFVNKELHDADFEKRIAKAIHSHRDTFILHNDVLYYTKYEEGAPGFGLNKIHSMDCETFREQVYHFPEMVERIYLVGGYLVAGHQNCLSLMNLKTWSIEQISKTGKAWVFSEHEEILILDKTGLRILDREMLFQKDSFEIPFEINAYFKLKGFSDVYLVEGKIVCHFQDVLFRWDFRNHDYDRLTHKKKGVSGNLYGHYLLLPTHRMSIVDLNKWKMTTHYTGPTSLLFDSEAWHIPGQKHLYSYYGPHGSLMRVIFRSKIHWLEHAFYPIQGFVQGCHAGLMIVVPNWKQTRLQKKYVEIENV